MTDAPSSQPITVIGSINWDLVMRVAHLPRRGETVAGLETHRQLGGKGANQAVAAAKLGGTVEWIGAVGSDGRRALEALNGYGVTTERAVTVAEEETGLAVLLVESSGENTIVLTPGANGALRPRDVLVPSEGIILLQNEVPEDVVHTVLRESPKATTILNPAPYRPLPHSICEYVDVLVLNAGELSQLVDRRSFAVSPEEARQALEQAPAALRTVIATLGPEGALIRRGTRYSHIPAPQVTPVDTVGAGDTFCGALAAELSAGTPLENAVSFAVHAASISVRQAGTQKAMPTRREVEEQRQKDQEELSR